MIDVLSGNQGDTNGHWRDGNGHWRDGNGHDGNGHDGNGHDGNGHDGEGGTGTGASFAAPTATLSLGRFGIASPERLRLDPEPPPPPAQNRRRRRWPWALSSVAAAVVLCAGSFVLGRATKPVPPPPAPPPPPPATSAVVALARSVTEGQALSSGDLTVVTIVTGPGAPKGRPQPSTKLSYFPASMEPRLVGQHVRSQLPPGALLLPAELSDGPFPAKGQALVGMDLQPGEAPTGGSLVAGDQVGVLFVPAASQPPYPAPEPMGTAQVVSSVPGQSGDSYVSVLVPADLAGRVAAYAEHNEVALVRLGPGEAWPAVPATATAKPGPTTTSPPTTDPVARTTTAPVAKKTSPPRMASHRGEGSGPADGPD